MPGAFANVAETDPTGTWKAFRTIDGDIIQMKELAHGGGPAVAAAAGAGTAPPAPTLAAGSSDARGTVNWGTGTTPAAGAQVAVTFAAPYAVAPTVILQPANAATAALGNYVTGVSTTGFSVALGSAPAASQAAGTYSDAYHVVQ
jgi:hypothetical protein